MPIKSLIFFWARDPKPESPKRYPEFRQVYPVMDPYTGPAREIVAPVISCVSSSSRQDYTFTVFLPDDTTVEIDVTPYRYDDILRYMALEEELLKLIEAEKVPADAWFRV